MFATAELEGDREEWVSRVKEMVDGYVNTEVEYRVGKEVLSNLKQEIR